MQAMHIVHQDQAIHVFGIELRTSNDELPKTFIAEYERYTAQGDIDIFIGLDKEAVRA